MTNGGEIDEAEVAAEAYRREVLNRCMFERAAVAARDKLFDAALEYIHAVQKMEPANDFAHDAMMVISYTFMSERYGKLWFMWPVPLLRKLRSGMHRLHYSGVDQIYEAGPPLGYELNRGDNLSNSEISDLLDLARGDRSLLRIVLRSFLRLLEMRR